MSDGVKERVLEKLTRQFKDSILFTSEFRGELTLLVKKEDLVSVCEFLKRDAELAFDLLEDLSGVDMYTPSERYRVVYHLYSLKNKFRLRLKVVVEEDDLTVPTVSGVWSTANWHEREAYDMLGIRFDGHPDLRRLYMPEEFEYYPLRKDFPLMGVPGSLFLPKKEGPGEGRNEIQHSNPQKRKTDSRNVDPSSGILGALEDEDTSVLLQDPLESEMVLNMGPQHPATHGVLRILLRLDGETILKAVPELGYLHRGYEKLAESCSYHEYITHTDRLDYLAPISNNVAYVLAVEKLAGVEVPERAAYIRVICCELARISSHLVWLGTMGMDVGALTILLWTFREREKLYDIFDLLTGARFTTSYTRIGGLSQDLTDECAAMIRDFIDQFPEKLAECENLLNKNRIFIERTDGIGVISPDEAIDIGLTGPMLRACGVNHDLRRANPYLVYDQLEFDVPIYDGGDSLSRYYVRIAEMKESTKIVQQVLDRIPKGPIKADDPKRVLPKKERVYTKMEELINDFMVINFGISPPLGEIYHAIESPKGELGFYVISDGSGNPWRLKIRAPSMVNLQSLPILLKGQMISDVVAIIGSLDPVMGEADK